MSGEGLLRDGRRDYEADVQKRPLYHDGTPRRPWDQLSAIARWSWAAVVRCAAGHRQRPSWTPSEGCRACVAAQEEIEGGPAERKAWQMANPAPVELAMRVMDTGRIIRFRVPPHARRRISRQRGR
jgi:hypothetical protein